MKKSVIQFALVAFSLVLIACGKKADSGLNQGQNNNNNTNQGASFDPATSTITLDPAAILIGSQFWNAVNGPGQFNGMRNLIRVFKLPSNFTGTLQLGLPVVNYSQCGTRDIRRNIRFTVIQNGAQYFVSNKFYLFGDGTDKFLVVKLEEVDCVTAGFQFQLNRVF